MLLHVLFMQRKESYPEEFAPEVVLAIDERTLAENPEHWEAEVATKKIAHKDDAAGFAELTISIDGDEVRRRCLGQLPSLKGRIADA